MSLLVSLRSIYFSDSGLHISSPISQMMNVVCHISRLWLGRHLTSEKKSQLRYMFGMHNRGSHVVSKEARLRSLFSFLYCSEYLWEPGFIARKLCHFWDTAIFQVFHGTSSPQHFSKQQDWKKVIKCATFVSFKVMSKRSTCHIQRCLENAIFIL